METVSGVVEAVRKDGKGFAINDVWYSTYNATKVAKGDSVVFNYEKKGNWNNVKGNVRIASGGGGNSQPQGARGSYNLGVEVGHAANLAMRMIEQSITDNNFVGTQDYYRQFTKYTVEMYDLMTKIKDTLSKVPPPEKESQKKETVSVDSDLDEDIFG